MKEKTNLVITSYLEPLYIKKIKEVDDQLNVIYRPDLIPAPRYAADHVGGSLGLSAEQEQEWAGIMASADILFDFDYSHSDRLAELAPNVRWIQATSAGIGQFVKRKNFAERLPGCVFTTASGVHARPLAEFVILSMLMYYKGMLQVLEQQKNHHWERYAGTDMEGRTMLLVGVGRIGSQVARLARCMGMRVLGTDLYPKADVVDEFFDMKDLAEYLPKADVLVLTVPHTPETEKMISAREFCLMPQGAYFVNIARGAVVVEKDLIEALRSGQLGGAGLDVFEEEPLPEQSPLWEMPNVIVCPHSASTSDRENERITDLFCDNLRRFLDGKELLNVLDIEKMF